MADKDNTDPHHVSTPKAKTEYSEPNDMKSLLNDLDPINLAKNLAIMDEHKEMKLEKHKQEKSLPKTFEDTTSDKELPLENVRYDKGEEFDPQVKKEIKKVHDEAPALSMTNLVAALDFIDKYAGVLGDFADEMQGISHSLGLGYPDFLKSKRSKEIDEKIKRRHEQHELSHPPGVPTIGDAPLPVKRPPPQIGPGSNIPPGAGNSIPPGIGRSIPPGVGNSIPPGVGRSVPPGIGNSIPPTMDKPGAIPVTPPKKPVVPPPKIGEEPIKRPPPTIG